MKLFSVPESVILLFLTLGLVSALQQCPLHALSHYGQAIASGRSTSHLQSSTTNIEEEPPPAVAKATKLLAPSDWEEQFEELLSFKAKYGHYNFPPNAPIRLEKEYPSLTIFLDNQRLEYRRMQQVKGRMSLSLFDRAIRCRRLEEIGYEFNVSLDYWFNRYHELEEYHQQHGHVNISKAENESLWFWMYTQRRKNAGIEKGLPTLSETQIDLLNRLNFQWDTAKERYDAQWHAKYKELVDFKNRHGHLLVDTGDHEPLANWIIHQRARRGGAKWIAPLSDEQFGLLEDVGFPWEPEFFDSMWRATYEELVRFQKKHGHCKPSKSTHKVLNNWSYDQLRKRKNGALSTEQIKLLDEIDFPWERNKKMWYVMYKELLEFGNEHDHLETQGKRYEEKKGQKPLSDEELELLEQIDFDFLQDHPHRAWNEMYAQVERYRQENNNRFPISHKDDKNLSRWVRQQRRRLRGEYGYVPLSSEQRSLLENVDFPMRASAHQVVVWNEKYDELVNFWKQHGHFLVDRDQNLPLSKWVTDQRIKYKRTSGRDDYPLTRSQIYLLDRIGFPWTSDRLDQLWQMQYDELVQFLEEKGHFPGFKENPKLNGWMGKQRVKYKGQVTPALSKLQIEQLEKIGFRWSIRE